MRTEVPIPKKMRGLGKDPRGYPIPFIVQRNVENKPHFTANDSIRQHRCLVEKRCPICGSRLDRELWFVGGPVSAFHEHGTYLDTPMHHECMTYAMQVCPYLAMPRYLGRIDGATIDMDKLPPYVVGFVDPSIIPERPVVFVAVMSFQQTISYRPGRMAYVKPNRPYRAVEYWRFGQMLSEEEGRRLAEPVIEEAMKAYKLESAVDATRML